MYKYDEECLNVFLAKQSQLFDEDVVNNLEEAEAFLEDSMAVVCESIEAVRECLDEEGIDIQAMTLEELAEASEVFSLSNGRYLVIEA
jgi:hypothetical protein